jgi:prolyl-tRNA editing enzyme YbaK/EbsC (Cys-tRNA(Pro) deacylase)
MQFSESIFRVEQYLTQARHPHAPVMLPDAARTAQQAADGLGVQLGQIAKSIIFRRKSDDVAVLAITSGDKRVDEKKLHNLVCADGQKLGRADADFVKAKTGFFIGGVSPVAHATPCVTVIDAQLGRFDEIWAAAGHPHAVFKLSFAQLCALTAAPVHDVTAQDIPSLL